MFMLFITLMLAGVAIFTAVRLYQLRNAAVAPNVPSSIPHAEGVNQCQVTFAIAPPTPTLSPTPTPTETLAPTPTPTPVPACNNSCTADSECPTDLNCSSGFCRNASCADQTSCVCPTTAPTPTTPPTGAPNSCNGTCGSDANCLSGYYFCYNGYCRDRSCPDRADCTCPGITPVPTPAPTIPALPQSGTDWPTVFGAGVGVFVIIGSLLLAL